MRKLSYYVYTNTDCTHYDNLEEAIEKYNSVEMKELKDSVFLGIESDDITPTSGVCFDVIHKFFGENILINDWRNHMDEDDVVEKVKEIISKFLIKYQFTYDLLNGVLIPYAEPWVKFSMNETMDNEWNEVYIETYKDGDFVSVGWKENNWNTIGNYQWQYPSVASYIKRLNVKCTDESGMVHERDLDPREYLAYHGKRFTDYR